MSSSIPNDYDDRDGEDDGFLTDGESGYILDSELDSDYNWYNTIIGRLLLLFGYSRNDVVKRGYSVRGAETICLLSHIVIKHRTNSGTPLLGQESCIINA